jgi:NodT family efflux transporter outer membrane factor (OMF) lipoprotein
MLALVPLLVLAQQPDPVAAWWANFEDPKLTALVERAVQNNRELQVAAARIVEARALAGQSRSALLPSINASTGASRLRGGFNQGIARVSSQSFVSPFETGLFQGSSDARWELDVFGGLRKDLAAARADATRTEEQRRDVQVILAADVAKAYLELRGAQEQLAIARKNVASQQEVLDLTKARAEAGLATELDVQRQRLQLANTEAQIPLLLARESTLVHRLGLLTGEKPQAHVDLKQAAPQPALPASLPETVSSSLLERRPDIRAAQARITAQVARVGSAKTDLFPKFSISGLLGRQGTTISGLTLGGGNFFNLGPTVTLPLFTAGRIKNQIAAEQARLEQEKITYEQTMLKALEETESAAEDFRQGIEQREKVRVAVSASRESFELAQELYTRGLNDFLNVLDAQRSLFTSEDELARVETKLRTDLVRYYRALGGGWK